MTLFFLTLIAIILLFENGGITMQRILAEGEALQQVGVMGLRAPDGSIAENVKLYRIIPAKDINQKSNLTSGEEAACEDIGKVLADKFREYKNGIRKAEVAIHTANA